jgi:hypothetical protein
MANCQYLFGGGEEVVLLKLWGEKGLKDRGV